MGFLFYAATQDGLGLSATVTIGVSLQEAWLLVLVRFVGGRDCREVTLLH